MSLVENLPRYAVIKRRHVPIAVTAIATSIERFEGNTYVARPATDLAVVRLKRPAGIGVIERSRLGSAVGPVATSAATTVARCERHIQLVAFQAGAVVFDKGARPTLTVLAVALCAIGFVMALDTLESKAIDVPLVSEDDSNRRSGRTRSVPQPVRLRNTGMLASENAIAGTAGRRGTRVRCTGFGHMTDFAGGLVDPISMAVQALLMVRTLQTRLVDVGAGGRTIVTVAAGRWPAGGWSVVMARSASFTHLGHGRMPTVLKGHWPAFTFDLVKNDDIGRDRHLSCQCDGAPARVIQAKIGPAWVAAVMTATAISRILRPGTGLMRRRGHVRLRLSDCLRNTRQPGRRHDPTAQNGAKTAEAARVPYTIQEVVQRGMHQMGAHHPPYRAPAIRFGVNTSKWPMMARPINTRPATTPMVKLHSTKDGT